MNSVRVKVIISVFLLTPLLLGQPTLGAAGLSDGDEVRIGRALAKQFEHEEGLHPTPQTQRFDAYLQKFGEKLTAHAKRRIPYRFHFDPDPTFRSAFALPGGQIFVGAGILAYIDTEDQLATVLGHEIEHIDLGQCRERLVQELGKKNLSPAKFSGLKIDPFLPGYGKQNELAADRAGVKLAMDAGYSPQGAIRLLQTFVILGQQMKHTENEAHRERSTEEPRGTHRSVHVCCYRAIFQRQGAPIQAALRRRAFILRMSIRRDKQLPHQPSLPSWNNPAGYPNRKTCPGITTQIELTSRNPMRSSDVYLKSRSKDATTLPATQSEFPRNAVLSL